MCIRTCLPGLSYPSLKNSSMREGERGEEGEERREKREKRERREGRERGEGVASQEGREETFAGLMYNQEK